MKKFFVGLASAVAVSVLVSGCAGTQWSIPRLEVPRVDQGRALVCLDLPDNQLPAAHLAVDAWDKSLHRWKNVVAVDHGQPDTTPCTLWVHVSTDVPIDEAANHHPLAETSMVGGFEIRMRKGWYEQDIPGILMHEMGHAFGAQHVDGTLMNPTWAPHRFVCPDKTTVAQVAAWWQINLDTLSYCY